MAAKKVVKKASVAQVVETKEVAAVVEVAKSMKVNDIVSKLSTLQVDVASRIASVGADITGALDTLKNVNLAIDAQKDRLNVLYAVESDAIDRDELRAAMELERAEFDASLESRKEEWRRDVENYNYDLKKARKLEQDNFDAQLSKRNRDESDRVIEFNKKLAERESVMKLAENELVTLRQTVAGIDALVKKEVDKNIAIVTNSLKKDYLHQSEMAAKDSQRNADLATQMIKSLEAQVHNLAAQNSALSAQLTDAQKRVESVATEAVRASSGRQALEAVNQNLATMNQAAPKR
jgi:hypothetical protein